MLSISTSGKSPATSRRIREYFEEMLNVTSLYTLGYEDGKPVPIESQGLPYPVYLLLENRTCVVLCEQFLRNNRIKTFVVKKVIDQKLNADKHLSVANRCGASVVRPAPDELKPHHKFEDAFLVISDKSSVVDASCGSEGAFIRESGTFDKPSAGTHFTPDLVIDDNLIISVSARSSAGIDKVKHLHKNTREPV